MGDGNIEAMTSNGDVAVTAPDAPQKKPRRGRPPIIRSNDVVGAALALTQMEGLQGWSMLDVARRLNVSEGAVYRYFTRRDRLADAVSSAVLADIVLLGDEADPWERIEHTIDEAWDRLLRHPGVAARLLDVGFVVPSALRMVNHLLGALLDAGLDMKTAADSASIIVSWLAAAVQLRYRFELGLPTDADGSEVEQINNFPHLANVTSTAGMSGATERQHLDDLRVLLRGIRSQH